MRQMHGKCKCKCRCMHHRMRQAATRTNGHSSRSVQKRACETLAWPLLLWRPWGIVPERNRKQALSATCFQSSARGTEVHGANRGHRHSSREIVAYLSRPWYAYTDSGQTIGVQEFLRRAESQVWHIQAKLSQEIPEVHYCSGWPCRAAAYCPRGSGNLTASRPRLAVGLKWLALVSEVSSVKGEMRSSNTCSPQQIRELSTSNAARPSAEKLPL
jgi:hypothetical protein